MGTLNALSDEVRIINALNGWNVIFEDEWSDTYKIPALLALVTSEVSEALEAFRNDDKENFAEEIADVIIRCLDLTAGMNIDIDAEIRKKLEKNKLRANKHGGKRV